MGQGLKRGLKLLYETRAKSHELIDWPFLPVIAKLQSSSERKAKPPAYAFAVNRPPEKFQQKDQSNFQLLPPLFLFDIDAALIPPKITAQNRR